jgi:hypothetical protein
MPNYHQTGPGSYVIDPASEELRREFVRDAERRAAGGQQQRKPLDILRAIEDAPQAPQGAITAGGVREVLPDAEFRALVERTQRARQQQPSGPSTPSTPEMAGTQWQNPALAGPMRSGFQGGPVEQYLGAGMPGGMMAPNDYLGRYLAEQRPMRSVFDAEKQLGISPVTSMMLMDNPVQAAQLTLQRRRMATDLYNQSQQRRQGSAELAERGAHGRADVALRDKLGGGELALKSGEQQYQQDPRRMQEVARLAVLQAQAQQGGLTPTRAKEGVRIAQEYFPTRLPADHKTVPPGTMPIDQLKQGGGDQQQPGGRQAAKEMLEALSWDAAQEYAKATSDQQADGQEGVLGAALAEVVLEGVELAGPGGRPAVQVVLAAEHLADGVARQAGEAGDGADGVPFAAEFVDVHELIHSDHGSRPPRVGGRAAQTR